MSIDSLIQSALPRATQVRRLLHTWPELGYQETRTAQVIRDELDRIGVRRLAVIESAPTATLALIGDESKPCVALRADIDALPIHEQTGVEYASQRPGLMHACGHDGHTANLLGTAAVLKQLERDLPVCVKLIFQPAEEGGGGADRLVKGGALDGRVGPVVREIYGLHGLPGFATGMITTRPGAMLAATDTLRAVFRGVGCHGAFPHLGRDPIVAAAEAVTSLQQVVSREIDPTEPALITIGVFQAGTATNIIPDSARIEGTVRTLNHETRVKVRDAILRRLAGIAQAHGVSVDAQVEWGYPPTINDPQATARVVQTAQQVLGPDRYLEAARPVLGGEDFAYYGQAIPAAFFFLGLTPKGTQNPPPLHSDRFDFNDASMESGIRMFVELVLRA